MFIHLNTHSIYSKMNGLLSLNDLIKLCKKSSMKKIALTDVNGLWGFIRFVQSARNYNIDPIAGSNIITAMDEIVILVENQNGYENLCRIISDIHKNFNQSIANVIKNKSTGLFFISSNQATLESLKKVVPNTHLFVELRPGLEEIVIHTLSKKLKLEIVATGDVYFKSPDDWNAHKMLRSIYYNTTKNNLKFSQYKTSKHWFRTENQMVDLFPNSLHALNNSYYLADRCKTDWSFMNTIFPGLSLKDTYQSNKVLKEKVYRGAKKRYKELNDLTCSRIEYELDLINQKGFSPYFLIVEDIIKQTNSTIGRGSAAASVVSYCLFITQVDPIRHTLHFERFIHSEREDMPDIDIDFPWDERENILDYVFKKYGEKRTAMVSNQVFLKPRSAIREVGKVYGISNEEINNITKRIGWYRSPKKLEEWVESDPKFSNLDLDETIISILQDSEKIVGVFRNSSVHPGGVVIVPDEIQKYVPVLKATKGVQIVEWEKDQVEDSGLLKIDILGNRSLSVVRDTIKQVNLNYGGSESGNKYFNYHSIQPIGDFKTTEMMKKGKTMGVFYIESPATRQLLSKSGTVDFEHVVIYSSIIRPAANRFTNIMLSRIHGEEWNLVHPDLEFLRESYGIMVYEEQVSMAVMKMAGLKYSEAELLRKTMSRSSMEHLVDPWKKKFTNNSLRRGYSEEVIKKVWEMIESFVGYSFCKPHSASYAMLSFTCGYLKAHFTAEFLASVISNRGGFYSSYAYMSEARRFGIKIIKPSINKSYYEWRGYKNKIIMGFMSIKKLQKKAVSIILDERKAGHFESLDNFLVRTELDLADAMSLTNAGCFNDLALDHTHQEIAYKVAGYYLQNTNKTILSGTPFRNQIASEDLLKLELESFGYPVSIHPISVYRPIMSRRIIHARDIAYHYGKIIYLMGICITRKESITKKSQPMQFLTLEDETDIYECVLFPDTFKEFGDLLNWEKLFIIRGLVEKSFGVHSITIQKMASIKQWVKRSSQNNRMKYNQ